LRTLRTSITGTIITITTTIAQFITSRLSAACKPDALQKQ
jgi:hypothetical protein